VLDDIDVISNSDGTRPTTLVVHIKLWMRDDLLAVVVVVVLSRFMV